MDERIYWVWLAEALGQGSLLAAPLLRRFETAEQIHAGAADGLEPDEEFRAETVSLIRSKLKNRSLARAEDIVSRCDGRGIRVVTCDDEEYPGTLRSLRDMPLVLYVLGTLPDVTG